MKYSGKQFANMTYEVEVLEDCSIVTVFLDNQPVYKKTFTGETHKAMMDFSRKEILANLSVGPMSTFGELI